MNIQLIAQINIEIDRLGEIIFLTENEKQNLSNATHIQIVPTKTSDIKSKIDYSQIIGRFERFPFGNVGIGKSFQSTKEGTKYHKAWDKYLKAKAKLET